eukprot:TRINITY_DN9296_c0_g3_i2.p1 TRINITY_DN9296_c0_g3~~TRINITY_DN9296_c0_g3_i2.p1  ORF type:complete len:483 (-),score=53.10 TRINITY_DN9296_c0_g3_i2:115-1563(-)
MVYFLLIFVSLLVIPHCTRREPAQFPPPWKFQLPGQFSPPVKLHIPEQFPSPVNLRIPGEFPNPFNFLNSNDTQKATCEELPDIEKATLADMSALVAEHKNIRVDHSVVRNFEHKIDDICAEEESGEKGKVAFLFMVGDELLHPRLWHSFFQEAATDAYNIYVHRSKESAQEQDLPLLQFGAQAVPRVETAWCGIFGGEVALLYHALAHDPANQQFVFISESTVPLKPFAYVYQELMLEKHTSKFCFGQAAKSVLRTPHVVQFLQGFCFFRDFYVQSNKKVMKHHQWIVLGRQHAKTVVSRSVAALRQWGKTWERQHYEGCSDESAPIAALLLDAKCPLPQSELHAMGIRRSCLTYVNWRGCLHGSELDLSDGVKDLKRLLRNVDNKTFVNFFDSRSKKALNGFPYSFAHVDERHLDIIVKKYGFMFARKFEKGATVTRYDKSVVLLEEVLPQKWAEASPLARQPVWSSLDTFGIPPETSRL